MTTSLENILDITISNPAIENLKKALSAQPKNKGIRLYFDFTDRNYKIAIDEIRNKDKVHEISGIKFVVDPYSFDLINGSYIEYHETEDVKGFKVYNPNLNTGNCRCSGCDGTKGCCS